MLSQLPRTLRYSELSWPQQSTLTSCQLSHDVARQELHLRPLPIREAAVRWPARSVYERFQRRPRLRLAERRGLSRPQEQRYREDSSAIAATWLLRLLHATQRDAATRRAQLLCMSQISQ